MKTLSLILHFLRRRAVAINEAMREIAIAANANALAAYEGDKPPTEEWLMISPYGEFPNPKGLQRVTKAHAEKMVTAFNSVLGRLGRLFRGLPIYVGHPDVMPDRWPDDRRIGKVTDLEARAEGLFGKVAWNDLGLRNREQGYHVFPSPAWLFPKSDRGVIDPDELLSIGMTNTPQIAESVPWTANAATTGTTQEKAMKDKLIKLLGLAADASDEQIETAVNAKLTEIQTLITQKTDLDGKLITANSRITTLEGDVKTVKDTAANARKAHAKDLLDTAINSGRITQAERAEFEAGFESDFDATAQKLAAKKDSALNTKEITLGDRKTSIATASERSAIIDQAVNARMKEGASYEAAFNAVQADPAFAAVFAAMKKSEAEEKQAAA